MPQNKQGAAFDRYTLIPRVLIFATRGDYILMIQGAPTKRLWANLYNGIGGHVESGESILDAAKREFLEETGLQLTNPSLAAVIAISNPITPGIGMFVFVGNVSQGDPSPSPEGTLHWVPLSSVQEYPLVEDLPILIPEVFSREDEQQVLFGHYQYSENGGLKVEFSNL